MTSKNVNKRPAWFVGAMWYGDDGPTDNTERFLRDGIWENGYAGDMYEHLIDDMEPGDRIAIKSWFNQQNKPGCPFDSRGHNVTGMEIKAIGTVVEHLPATNHGSRLKVRWTAVSPPRTFYFSAYQQTVHRIVPDNWKRSALIDFTFDNQQQDIDRWRNDPQYRGKFGGHSNANPPILPHPQSAPSPTPTFQRRYTIDSIIDDGCFLPRATLETMLQRLRTKQNIILQGPPGAGKTWLSKRLAYALIGLKDDDRVRQVQFHPNLSYEDFVRGWRPQGDGKLDLVDGSFLKLAEVARRDADGTYVMVIEEINRGNPASIFGELLTLLEADKRNQENALALAYPRDDGERFHIPPNVYVIGTMNLADRSLALVDFALRRRFVFFDLEPIFTDTWRDWVHEQSHIPPDFLENIAQRINSLNEKITDDANLGRQFRVGHSHFTPPPDTPVYNPAEWFQDAVDTEIAPLLREYWFDAPATAQAAAESLVAGL